MDSFETSGLQSDTIISFYRSRPLTGYSRRIPSPATYCPITEASKVDICFQRYPSLCVPCISKHVPTRHRHTFFLPSPHKAEHSIHAMVGRVCPPGHRFAYGPLLWRTHAVSPGSVPSLGCEMPRHNPCSRGEVEAVTNRPPGLGGGVGANTFYLLLKTGFCWGLEATEC